MKRAVSVLLILAVCAAALLSCAGNADHGDDNGDELPSVVATVFPQYDFARAIAGDSIKLTMLVPPGAESHTYEPTVNDLMLAKNADLFILTGGDSDEWASALLDAVGVGDDRTLYLCDACGVERTNGHDHGHDHGGENEDENDHLWTSPKNAALMLDSILEALVRIRPDHEVEYRAAAAAYKQRIERVGDALLSLAADSAGVPVAVADRFPFSAMFRDYGLSYVSALDGCAVGAEPPPSRLAELIDAVRGYSLADVFYIEFSSHNAADVVSSATGCGQLLLHSCHNVSREDFDRGVTYCDLMEQNVSNLRLALGED